MTALRDLLAAFANSPDDATPAQRLVVCVALLVGFVLAGMAGGPR